jgi:hypothetical protein
MAIDLSSVAINFYQKEVMKLYNLSSSFLVIETL